MGASDAGAHLGTRSCAQEGNEAASGCLAHKRTVQLDAIHAHLNSSRRNDHGLHNKKNTLF